MDVNQPIIYWILSEAVSEWDSLDNIGLLSATERSRFDSMRFEKRRREWFHGRQSAKNLLAGSSGGFRSVNPSDLSIENEPEGSPYVVHAGRRLDLSLSISHRDQLAFCGLILGRRGSIGVDIEKIEPRSPVFAEDFFTDSEVQLVEKNPVGTVDQTITLIWSAKEAVLKAMGKGLRLDTREIEISSFKDGAEGWGTFLVSSHFGDLTYFNGRWRIKGDYTLTLAVLEIEKNFAPNDILQLVQVIQASN